MNGVRCCALFCLYATLFGCQSTTVVAEKEQDPFDLSELAKSRGLDYRNSVAQYHGQDTHVALARPKTMHKFIGDYADQLAMTLMERAFTLKQSDKIVVASFVRFDHSLRQPTILGNRLAEALAIQLQQYGMAIVETKLASTLAITEAGDLALSRNTRQLADDLNVDYILTGTLMEKPSGIVVNARIISVASQAVAAAASLHVPDFIIANEHYYIHTE